jgi:glycosyltransferase involved in cell wall biosynthesis
MKIMILKDQRSQSGNEGTAKILLWRCLELNKRKIDYLVFYNAKDKFYRSLIKNNVNVIYLPFPPKSPKYILHKRLAILKFRKKIKKLINTYNITHIHVFHAYLLDFLDKKWCIEITADCYEAFQTNEQLKYFNYDLLLKPRLFLRAIYSKLIVNNYKKATKIVAASKAAKETLIKKYGVNKEKITIIYNGVGYLKIFNDQSQSIKKKLNIKYTDKVILSVGRVTKAKGVEDFCRIAQSYENEKNIKFIFVGGYTDKSYYENIKRKFMKNVIFTGELDNVANFYKISDIFLFLSHRESFGNVLVEAMQFRIPSVVWDITGLKEVIKNNHNGYRCPFGNINYAKNRINYLINNKDNYNRMCRNAYFERKKYSVSKNINKFLDLIRK